MRALSQVRKLAKEHGFKISIKRFTEFRSFTLVDAETGASLSSVILGDTDIHIRAKALRSAIAEHEGLYYDLLDQENDKYYPLTGTKVLF